MILIWVEYLYNKVLTIIISGEFFFLKSIFINLPQPDCFTLKMKINLDSISIPWSQVFAKPPLQAVIELCRSENEKYVSTCGQSNTVLIKLFWDQYYQPYNRAKLFLFETDFPAKQRQSFQPSQVSQNS